MNKGEPIMLKSIRMRESDYLRISELSKEKGMTNAEVIKILLDNYTKVSNVEVNGTEVKLMEEKRKNMILEEENNTLQKLLECKKNIIKKTQKQFLRVQEEKMQLEEKNEELEIRNRMYFQYI